MTYFGYVLVAMIALPLLAFLIVLGILTPKFIELWFQKRTLDREIEKSKLGLEKSKLRLEGAFKGIDLDDNTLIEQGEPYKKPFRNRMLSGPRKLSEKLYTKGIFNRNKNSIRNPVNIGLTMGIVIVFSILIYGVLTW